MFPHLHVMEVKRFLSVADGDCEKAVQLILQKEETGFVANKPLTSINNAAPQHISNCKEKIVEDKQLREQILKRYAYIDQDEDVREHKPVAPKTIKNAVQARKKLADVYGEDALVSTLDPKLEPKKLIRYRDNKIVSIKGERYSEVKKTEESGKWAI
ncbi:CUE domain-containing protein 2-B [Trichonephila clavipes]|nr:CUE domain-containing protein 2-B [Trichonephila clavipes]